MIFDFAVTTWKHFELVIRRENLVTGDDERMKDARTPTAHTHPSSEISDGKMLDRILTNGDQALLGSGGKILWK